MVTSVRMNHAHKRHIALFFHASKSLFGDYIEIKHCLTNNDSDETSAYMLNPTEVVWCENYRKYLCLKKRTNTVNTHMILEKTT